MGTFESAGYVLRYDPTATASAYAAIQVPGPEECGCWYCRNWIASREQVLVPEVRGLLTRFGVPPVGEIEVWEVPADAPGRRLYGGWYMIIGVIEAAPAGESPRELSMGPWRVSFTSGASYRVPEFGTNDVFEMHFLVEVDTVIDGSPSNPSPACEGALQSLQ